MYVFKGLGADAWAPTATRTPVASKLISMFRPTATAGAQQITPDAAQSAMATQTVVATEIPPLAPTPWYKTPLGIFGILVAAFVGYKVIKK